MVERGAASDFLEQMRMTNQNVGRKGTGIKCSHQQLEKFGSGRKQFEKQAAQQPPRARSNVKGNGTLRYFAERPRGARRIGKNIEIDRWRGGTGSDEMMKNFADAFVARLQLGQQCRSGIKAQTAREALALLGIFRNGMSLPFRFYLQTVFN